ncbi:hypothetical protein RJ639_022110 [Escallonia herrerae]|uniref:SHSP domain-containing protein n=1 Tax=Escallonia herrerae TaxID=1293975 RepID=A0AA88V629_9ASTE|nr:hypothetical protein RJ639_022110 [Escallonia herrerae]
MEAAYSEKQVNRIIWKHRGKKVASNLSNADDSSSTKCQERSSKRPCYDHSQMSAPPSTSNLDGPCMMPLLPIPGMEERNSKASIMLSGTARRGQTGSSVGAVDIGVSKSAYIFQVALPGVKKDPGHFSCEIEHDGMVHVRGVTSTGGKTVLRHSRVYEMKFRQQCPPGPFTLSFSLAGCVDPRLFYPNFRSDGILEAVIVKSDQCTAT